MIIYVGGNKNFDFHISKSEIISNELNYDKMITPIVSS